jgi:exosortase
MLAGVTLYLYGRTLEIELNQNDYSSLMTFSVFLFWTGAFIFFYGPRAFRIAVFPLLFLAFMIPIPSVLIDNIIYALQVASAEVTYLLFQILGLPVARGGCVFQLPGISIEVAKQCSGIRSSLALFIISILAAYLFLHSSWRRAILIFSILPIAVLKNGIRIVTLSLLAIYVDGKFLTGGFLHKSGGFVFYIFALALLGLLIWVLRKSEGENKSKILVAP